MSVSIDTVYQRVLGILNKEQRGYVTPQEFNLFANQAQLDLFEQYFYDINQFGRMPGNSTEFSDMLTLLNEKINIFETTATMSYDVPTLSFELPANLYRLGTIVHSYTPQAQATAVQVEAERINFNEYLYINASPLTKPKDERPIYVANNAGIKVYGDIPLISGVLCNYIKQPAKVEWKYQMVFGEALYDSTYSVDFELHPSEETELVIKVLEMAGLVVKDIQLYQIAAGEELKNTQEEKQ
tara:strand:- start:2732 stop:3454 length:723 start_codon:yes stop_codon:yes gene_type:complete